MCNCLLQLELKMFVTLNKMNVNWNKIIENKIINA